MIGGDIQRRSLLRYVQAEVFQIEPVIIPHNRIIELRPVIPDIPIKIRKPKITSGINQYRRTAATDWKKYSLRG